MGDPTGQLSCRLHPLGAAEVLLHPLALGDIAINAPDGRRLSVLEGAAEVAFDGDRGVGFGDQYQLDMVEALPRKHPLQYLAVGAAAVGVHDVQQPHLPDLVLGIAGPVLPGLVDVQQGAVRSGHADEIAGIVEQIAVALLAFPQRAIGAFPFAHVPGIEHDAPDGAVGEQVGPHRLQPDRGSIGSV
jgi:hypothetical protein